MNESMTYLIAAALGALAALCIVIVVLKLLNRRRRSTLLDKDVSPSGARLLSRTRYRGRRVSHFSDGTVVAETRFSSKAFESFDAYRFYVDRKSGWF